MATLTRVLTIVLLLWPLLTQAATYYVGTDGSDSRSCTQAQTDSPSTRKRTIQNTINNCWRNPGDILHIHGGQYPEQLHGLLGTNWPVGGSSWSNAMILRGAPGEQVIINPSATIDNFNVIYFDENNASGPPNYLIFDNLTVDGANLTISLSVSLIKFSDNADLRRVGHIRVQNSKIINSHVSCSGEYPGCGYGNGILSNAYANEYLNNEFYGNDAYAFYITGAGNLIDGNYMHDNAAYCIHLYHGGSPYVPLVDDNIVRNNACINNGYFNRNPVGSCGILASSGSNGQVYNNLIVNQNDPFGGSCGIQLYPSRPPVNWKFYNNTIVGNHGPCIDIQGGSGSDIRNNICYGNAQDIVVGGAVSALDHNNPNTLNPRFQDPANGDYRLQTTPTPSDAINAGANLTSTGVFTTMISSPFLVGATGGTHPAPPTAWDQGIYQTGAGGTILTPSKGTFFIDDTGTNTDNCETAKGSVGSPSSAPFGSYAVARQCMAAESTLYFRAGTYPPLDSASTPFIGGSSWSAPTTLAAYPGETVTLQATAASPVAVFLRNGTTDHFLILQGLILDGQNITGTNGFAATSGVNAIRLDGVEIKNTYYEGVFLSNVANIELRNGTAVHNSALAAVGVIGLDTTTNTVLTGITAYASAGPGISSYGGNTGLLIEKSTVRNTTGKAIVLGGDTNPKLYNNLLYNNTTYAVHLQTGVSGAQVYYNTAWSNTTACMLFDSGVTTSQATNNVCWSSPTVTNNAGAGMTLTTNQCTGPSGCSAGDPLFASTTPGDPNFLHLCGAAGVPVAGCTGASPARDSGTPIASLTSDFAGKARPDGSGVDKGAFEEVPPPPVPVNIGLVPPFRTTFFLVPH